MALTKVRGAGVDFDGQDVVLDADGDTKIAAGTDDVITISTAGTERVRVLSGGGLDLSVGNLVLDNGYGIDFSATANSSGSVTHEILDDYEIGTWTPSIGGNATYGSGNAGRYVKIGGLVHCTFLVDINSRGNGSQVQLSGLPFTSQTTGFVQTGSVSYFANLNSNVTFVGLYVENNATSMQFVAATGSAAATIQANGFSVFKDSTAVYGAVSYVT